MSIKRPVVCHLLICHCIYFLSKVLSLVFFKIAFFLWLNIETSAFSRSSKYLLLYYFYIFTGLIFLTVSIFSLPTSVWYSNIFNWQHVTPVGHFCYSFSTGYKIVLWSHREELRVGHQWNRKRCNGNIKNFILFLYELLSFAHLQMNLPFHDRMFCCFYHG